MKGDNLTLHDENKVCGLCTILNYVNARSVLLVKHRCIGLALPYTQLDWPCLAVYPIRARVV